MAWERDTLESFKRDDYGKLRTTIEKVRLKLILALLFTAVQWQHTEYGTQHAYVIQRAWYTACTVTQLQTSRHSLTGESQSLS